jgi:uncharacterized membrane protein
MNPARHTTDSVLVITFGDDPLNDIDAYQALTELKLLDSQDQVEIAEAAVVSRDADGRVRPYALTTSGGMLGKLVGILGGPLGVLLGGWAGLMIGSLFNLDEVETTESVLTDISKQIQPGRTAVLAHVSEHSPDLVDNVVERLGGEVMRRPAIAVEEEMAAAEQAQRNARREAVTELHRARFERRKEDRRAKVTELKSKLPRSRRAAA